jgi:hypothetical protein
MKLQIGGTLEINVIDEEPRIVFSVTISGVRVEDIKMLMLPNDHKVPVSIEPVDAKGNPAAVEGVPAWTSSAETIAYVSNIASDGLSAEVLPGDSIGTCQINVTADADLGSGVTPINGVLDVQVVAGQAVGFAIQTGALTPLAPAAKK